MKKSKLRLIVLTGLFAAIIFVFTFTFKIPSPFGHGYIHIGDSMNYLASCILPFPFGIIAGSIGGALSDLVGGYFVYILPTLIIKAFNSSCFYLLHSRGKKIISVRSIIAVILSSFVTIFGYGFVSVILYGTAGFVANLGENAVQAAGSLIVFIIIGITFDKTELTEKINLKFN